MSDRRLKVEIWIVLGLSLGMSGVYSAVALIDKATRPGGVRQSTATLNSNNNPREWFDFTYEVLGLVSAMVVAALVLGLVLSVLSRLAARATGRRRAAQADEALRAAIGAVSEQRVIAPVEDVLDAYRSYRSGILAALK